MRILIAEDDQVSRRLLETTLARWGHEVVTACDGRAAWEALQQPDAPRLALLDWMMPELDGAEVCRRVRARADAPPPYLILLTSLAAKESVVAGLEAGADDYIVKPFQRDELRARLNAGRRVVDLQDALGERVRQLEEALAQVKRLRGLVPMCAWCKRVRNDQHFWQQVETYLGEHADVTVSHGICPDCLAKATAAGR
jgi:phosphoserine phosphatase RsbU/P